MEKWVCVWISLHMHLKAEADRRVSQQLPTLFFEAESPNEPRAHGYGYSCSGHHHCKSKWPVLPTQHLHGIWGAELQSYHLHRKFLTTEQSSPNPASCFWVLLDRLVEWVGVLFCFLLCSASEIHIYMYIKAPLIAAVV